MQLTLRRSLPRCGRCGGQMYEGLDGEQSCIHCGEVVYPPDATVDRGMDAEEWEAAMRPKRGRPRKVRPENACA